MNECKKGRNRDQDEDERLDCWKYEVAEDYDLNMIVLNWRMNNVDIDELGKGKGKRQR